MTYTCPTCESTFESGNIVPFPHLRLVPGRTTETRKVCGVEPAGGRSLRFALMAAAKHAENGEGNAMLTALADAIWIQHVGEHEHLYEHEVVAYLRGVVGAEWTPPGPEDAA